MTWSGRSDQQDRFRVGTDGMDCRSQDSGGSIAALRLDHDRTGINPSFDELFRHDEAEVSVGEDNGCGEVQTSAGALTRRALDWNSVSSPISETNCLGKDFAKAATTAFRNRRKE